MKSITHIIVVLSVILTFTAGCNNNPNKLDLSGTVKGVSTGKVYLKRYDNKSFFTIDSTSITNGSFKFRTETALPEIYGLSLSGSDEDPFNSFLIFLDNKPITVELDTTAQFKHTVVEGSAEHDLFKELMSRRGTPINEIIEEHPSSIAALYVFYRYHSFRLSPDEIKKNIALLDPALQNSTYVTVLNDLAETMGKVSIGQKAPDFVAYNAEGDGLQLSEFLGDGYLLLDFWASWCAPCRKENPHLVKVYDKYKTKQFEIVGVSLDNAVTPWINAIEKDGLTWPQLIDQDAWAGNGAENYGVRLIPANFLIDENGIIVAQNLKGEELEKTLEDLLQ